MSGSSVTDMGPKDPLNPNKKSKKWGTCVCQPNTVLSAAGLITRQTAGGNPFSFPKRPHREMFKRARSRNFKKD